MPTTHPIPEPRPHASPAARAPRAEEPHERLHGPGELIAYLPYLIGYHPAPGDVVFVAIRGNRLLGAAVVSADDDIATSGDRVRLLWKEITALLLHPAAGLLLPGQISQTCQTRSSFDDAGNGTSPADPAVAGQAPDQVVIVSYGSPQADALAWAVLRLDQQRKPGSQLSQQGPQQPELADVLCVSAGRWRSLTCPGIGCGPQDGEPVPDVTAATARSVLDGVSPRGLHVRNWPASCTPGQPPCWQRWPGDCRTTRRPSPTRPASSSRRSAAGTAWPPC